MLILDVGNCQPDYATLRDYLTRHFDCEVRQTHGLEDTLRTLREQKVDLVTINRKLDRDYTDGIEVLKRLKSDPAYAELPVMLITNYAEHQDTAVALGAERGFGKLEYDRPETLERIAAALGTSPRTRA